MTDLERIQTDYTNELVDASILESQGRIDEALRKLELFKMRYPTIEWVRNTVNFQQGSILYRSGNLESALTRYAETSISPQERLFFLLNSLCKARVLVDLGRESSALAELRNSLDAVHGSTDTTDMGLILLYLSLANKLRTEIPREHQKFACAVFHQWRIDCSETMFGNSDALAHLVDQGSAAIESQRQNRS